MRGLWDGRDEGVTCGEEQGLTEHGVKHGEQRNEGAGELGGRLALKLPLSLRLSNRSSQSPGARSSSVPTNGKGMKGEPRGTTAQPPRNLPKE